MSQPTRNLALIVFKNFINSFRPRQIRGNLIGTDHFGTKYYEIPANPSVGKRKASRWFEPVEKDDFQQEMPAEWEAWLRGRRIEAPTEEEILKNRAIIEMKRKNAAALEEKFARPETADVAVKEVKGMESFPKYEEYEIRPGVPRQK